MATQDIDVNRHFGDKTERLRLPRFEPDGTTLAVRTFSPLKLDAGQSPWWDDPAWRFRVRLSAGRG